MREIRLLPDQLRQGDMIQLRSDKSPGLVMGVAAPFGGRRWRLDVAYPSGSRGLRTVRDITPVRVLLPETDEEDPFDLDLLRLRAERLLKLIDDIEALPAEE